MHYFLYTLPFLTALTSFLTLICVIGLFFSPSKPRKIFFFTIQGIVPRYKRELALLIASSFKGGGTKEIFMGETKRALEQSVDSVSSHLIEAILEGVKEEFPMAKTFMHGKVAQKIKALAEKEVQKQKKSITLLLGESLQGTIDFRQLAERMLTHIDEQKLFLKVQRTFRGALLNMLIYGTLFGFLLGALFALLLIPVL